MILLCSWAYQIGIALPIGSIATFIVVSTLAARGSLTDFVFARQIIWTGSLSITMPGLWLATCARAGLLWQHRTGSVLEIVQLAVASMMVLFGHLLILPAARKCLALARQSQLDGRMHPAYQRAYAKETTAGAVNLLLAVLSPLATR